MFLPPGKVNFAQVCWVQLRLQFSIFLVLINETVHSDRKLAISSTKVPISWLFYSFLVLKSSLIIKSDKMLKLCIIIATCLISLLPEIFLEVTAPELTQYIGVCPHYANFSV